MGDFDLVADALRAEGVEIFFAQVAVKPGKPTVFGRRGRTLVFGLPGNPVSTFVMFEILVRPSVRKRLGRAVVRAETVKANLAHAFDKVYERDQVIPATLRREGAGLVVARTEWHGSADLFGLSRSNAMFLIPARTGPYPAGTEVTVMPIPEPEPVPEGRP